MKTLNNNKKINLQNAAIFILSAIAMFVFFSFIPYTGEDWLWATSTGQLRLDNLFSGYNGRYLANFASILLGKSGIVKTVLMSGIILVILVCVKRFSGKKDMDFYFFGVLLLLLLPRTIFRQTISYVSGFANYVLPVCVTLVYFAIIKNIFNEKILYRRRLWILTFFLGIIGALFNETTTVFHIVVGIIVLIYSAVKFKRLCGVHITFVFGSLAGAVLMFLNSGYINNSSELAMSTSSVSIDSIFTHLVYNNVLLNLVIAALTLIAAVRYFSSHKNVAASRKTAIYFSTGIILLYSLYCLLKQVYVHWKMLLGYTKHFETIFALIFILALFIFVFSCIDNAGKRHKMLFLLFGVIINSLLFLMLNNLSGKNFIATYVLFVLFAIEIYTHIMLGSKPVKSAMSYFLILVITLMGFYYTSIFYYVSIADNDRTQYIKEQISENAQTVEVPRLPYDEYVWLSTPDSKSTWEAVFKEYYGIDEGCTISIITYENWKG